MTDAKDLITHECDTCSGSGKVDETLGGYHFSNPSATCPDCDGCGEWYSEPAKGEGQ